MTRLAALLLALLPALPARSQSMLGVDFNPDAKQLTLAEKELKAWLGRQPILRRKLKAVARRAAALAASRPDDLRDAVASTPPPASLPSRIAAAAPDERASLIERLPGMKPAVEEACPRLEACLRPPMSLEAARAAAVGPAVWDLIRPWMLLQQARGRELGVVVDGAPGDRLLKLELEDGGDSGLDISVAPLETGGYQVWLSAGFDAAAYFAAQRRALLPK